MASGSESVGSSSAVIPALSVVMPAFNAEAFIGEAIDSILGQTFTDLELVIVDDASSDSTWSIIEKRAKDDPRVRVFRNESNLGVAGSINRGIEMSRAVMIGRMDADDISDLTRFEKQMAKMAANPHFAVVGTFASHMSESGRVLSLSATGPASEAEFDELRRVGEPTMVFGGTALFTKELFERVGGFDGTLRAASDLELFDRMADHGPIVAIPAPLLLYRLHSGSIVATRFLEGRQVHRFVAARRRAQNGGAEPMSLPDFMQWEHRRPMWRRINVVRDDKRQYQYRRAGMAYGQGDRKGFVWHFATAFVISPIWVARRLWSQRFSRTARVQNQRV